MAQAPSFFVPATSPETQEVMFADLARFAGRPVPGLSERVHSITYIHDGEEWIATVGEPLHGVRYQTTGSKDKKIERGHPVADPAVILAIFPGVPYKVVTNSHPVGNVRSAWENPFFAGQPKSVTCFSAQ